MVRGVIPFLGGLSLFLAVGNTAVKSWSPDYGTVLWTVPGTGLEIGGVFILGIGSMLLGFPPAVAMRPHGPDSFRGGRPARGCPRARRIHRPWPDG